MDWLATTQEHSINVKGYGNRIPACVYKWGKKTQECIRCIEREIKRKTYETEEREREREGRRRRRRNIYKQRRERGDDDDDSKPYGTNQSFTKNCSRADFKNIQGTRLKREETIKIVAKYQHF